MTEAEMDENSTGSYKGWGVGGGRAKIPSFQSLL